MNFTQGEVMEDDGQQQRDDEERLMRLIIVLQKVSRGTSTREDALYLALELGIVNQWRQYDR